MSPIEKIFRSSFPLRDKRETTEWAAANVDFGNSESFKGAYNVEHVPWTRDILRALDDPRVREVSVCMPPQESGKTKMAEVFICRRISDQPAKMAFNLTTDVKAKKWNDTRWQQMVGTENIRPACAKVRERFSSNKHDATKHRIVFKDGSFLIIQGIDVDANRESDSVEVQVNDECQLWDEPYLTQVHARTRAFAETCKRLNIGLGGKKGSTWHQRFNAGHRAEWSHHCPACDALFHYRFNLHDPQGSNIHFDKTKVQVMTDGTLDFTDFRPTVYVTCPTCGARIDYDRDLLARMNLDSMRRGDGWVAMNPGASPDVRSFHANSFALGRRPWWEIVEPWIRATMGRTVFATSLLQQFITHELAEFWEERPIVTRKTVAVGHYTRAEARDPRYWSDFFIRVMAVDNQEGGGGDIPHRWFVVRDFSRTGASRLVDCGRINEWLDVRKRQIELKVPVWTPQLPGPWVAVDRWHKPQEVDEECARYKWHGMLGQDTEEFLHKEPSAYAGQKLLFSDERVINLSFGTAEGPMYACYILYAKQKIEDILASLRSGKAEPWEVPADLNQFCPEYFEHINSHHQVMESTKNGERLMWRGISGAPDHLYDCETELVVLGLMAGVFKR